MIVVPEVLFAETGKQVVYIECVSLLHPPLCVGFLAMAFNANRLNALTKCTFFYTVVFHADDKVSTLPVG